MKTHRFDGVSFFSGLVITVIGLLFLLPRAPTGLFAAIRGAGVWFWPLLLLSIGLVVLIPAIVRQTSDEDGESEV